MKSLKRLLKAIENKETLIYNDPDPIEGNDYTISYIQEFTKEDKKNFNKDYPILIQYNNGLSESEILLKEISIKP